MRISDWSSDVCSSDLHLRSGGLADHEQYVGYVVEIKIEGCGGRPCLLGDGAGSQIQRRTCLQQTECGKVGRASCRARGCQYWSISLAAVSLTKKQSSQV